MGKMVGGKIDIRIYDQDRTRRWTREISTRRSLDVTPVTYPTRSNPPSSASYLYRLHVTLRTIGIVLAA